MQAWQTIKRPAVIPAGVAAWQPQCLLELMAIRLPGIMPGPLRLAALPRPDPARPAPGARVARSGAIARRYALSQTHNNARLCQQLPVPNYALLIVGAIYLAAIVATLPGKRCWLLLLL